MLHFLRWLRPTSPRRTHPLRTAFRHRLAFERLENRCLMSSGFDFGVATSEPLRSPLLDEEARKRIAIHRLSTDFHVTGGLTSDSSTFFRVIYDHDEWQGPENLNSYDVPPGNRPSAAGGRPGQSTRPDSGNSHSTSFNETDTQHHHCGLDVISPGVYGEYYRVPISEEADHQRRQRHVVGAARPQPSGWATRSAAGDSSDWNWDGFENARRRQTTKDIRTRSAKTESTVTEEETDPFSAVHLAAFHEAEATHITPGVLSVEDLDAWAADIATQECDAGNPAPPLASGAYTEDKADPWFDYHAIDSAFAAMADLPTPDALVVQNYAQACPSLAATETVTIEEQGCSAAAMATAVLVASRGETKQSKGTRQGKQGWLGIAAQFMLTPRFTTPKRPTILVAMRDETGREQLAEALRDDGYEVLGVGSLGEAVKHVVADWVTLDGAVLDADLDYPGIHLCNKIREHYPRLPIVVCSDADHPDLRQFRRLGARRCLLKPIEPNELLAAVNALVG